MYILVYHILMHHLLHFDLRPVVFSQLSSFINGVKDKTNRSCVFTAWRRLAHCSTSSLHNSMVITSERWSFWHINCPVHSLAEHDYIPFFVADLDKHWFRSSTLHIFASVWVFCRSLLPQHVERSGPRAAPVQQREYTPMPAKAGFLPSQISKWSAENGDRNLYYPLLCLPFQNGIGDKLVGFPGPSTKRSFALPNTQCLVSSCRDISKIVQHDHATYEWKATDLDTYTILRERFL